MVERSNLTTVGVIGSAVEAQNRYLLLHNDDKTSTFSYFKAICVTGNNSIFE